MRLTSRKRTRGWGQTGGVGQQGPNTAMKFVLIARVVREGIGGMIGGIFMTIDGMSEIGAKAVGVRVIGGMIGGIFMTIDGMSEIGAKAVGVRVIGGTRWHAARVGIGGVTGALGEVMPGETGTEAMGAMVARPAPEAQPLMPTIETQGPEVPTSSALRFGWPAVKFTSTVTRRSS